MPTASRRHSFGFWAIAFAFVMVMAFSTVPTPLYLLYQQRDDFSPFMITLIFAAYAVGVLVSLFLAGHVSDWYGRRRVLLLSVLISVVSAVIFLALPSLPGLFLGRVLSGLSVGMMTATATAWLAELHSVAHPDASGRRSQVASIVANLGGLGLGSLIAGMLAQWIDSPLRTPYLVFVALLILALIAVSVSPETKPAAQPVPRYRPQRVSVPASARAQFFSAATGAVIAFATFGLFTSLAPSFLASSFQQTSRVLAGATAFIAFAAAVFAQAFTPSTSRRNLALLGIGSLWAGMIVLAGSVWLDSPSLILFLIGGVLSGSGAGLLFKATMATVLGIATPENRAECVAGLFLAAYVGLTIPVIGLGFLDRYVEPRVGLLAFGAVLILGSAAAAPRLAQRPTRQEGR